MTPRPRRSVAFTLPEVLACLVLIGIALPAVMRGVSISLAAADDARKRVEAVGLAETQLAELVASARSSQSPSTAGDFGAERPAYHWTASTDTVATDLIEIRLRVTWNARNAEHAVELSTFAYVGSGASSGSLGTTASSPESPGPPSSGSPSSGSPGDGS